MEFCSEYANVKYIKEDNIVLLVWKKPAYLENYRKPTELALEMLRSNEGSNFVVDARNGFEDDKRDVEWGVTYLLPEMAKTSCRFVCFIMNKGNDIESEMEMWTNWKEQKRHRLTKHYDLLSELKSKYVEKVDISCYKVEEALEA